MNPTSSQNFLAFYRGKQPDSQGRLIGEIWQWDYALLETTHDYIQWLFPLTEKSGFNYRAPVLDSQTITVFRMSEELRERLLTSLKVLLAFYGLQIYHQDHLTIKVGKSSEYEDRKANWVKPGNHNHLRLTRILKSLRTLGLERYAEALFVCLERIYQEESDNIEELTYAYWREASTSE